MFLIKFEALLLELDDDDDDDDDEEEEGEDEDDEVFEYLEEGGLWKEVTSSKLLHWLDLGLVNNFLLAIFPSFISSFDAYWRCCLGILTGNGCPSVVNTKGGRVLSTKTTSSSAAAAEVDMLFREEEEEGVWIQFSSSNIKYKYFSVSDRKNEGMELDSFIELTCIW
jgi:hypothetical protein